MNNLELSKLDWKEFKIGELFNVLGTTTTQPNELISNGIVPRVTCAATNNGIEETYKNLPTEKGGVLTVDSATIGYIGFQENDFIATDHVEKIEFINNKPINKKIGLFLKAVIKKSIGMKFGYGYKFSQSRIRKQIIMLPVDNQEEPNWKFMEDYIRQEQSKIATRIVDYYTQKILENSFELRKLDEKEWKEFKFKDIFREIKRGKRLKKDDHIDGKLPYISSKGMDNGVDGFIGNEINIRKFQNNLTIANSGSVGSCFYHQYEYIASDHVTGLSIENGNKDLYLFMSTIIKRLESKYSFNREINNFRIQKEKIILPVDKNKEPDWEYMRKFMKNIEVGKLDKVLDYINKYIE